MINYSLFLIRFCAITYALNAASIPSTMDHLSDLTGKVDFFFLFI